MLRVQAIIPIAPENYPDNSTTTVAIALIVQIYLIDPLLT